MPLARMPSRLAWAMFNLLQLAFTLIFTAGGIVYCLVLLAITRDPIGCCAWAAGCGRRCCFAAPVPR